MAEVIEPAKATGPEETKQDPLLVPVLALPATTAPVAKEHSQPPSPLTSSSSSSPLSSSTLPSSSTGADAAGSTTTTYATPAAPTRSATPARTVLAADIRRNFIPAADETRFETIRPASTVTARVALEGGIVGSELVGLESVMGVTARVGRANALGYNAQRNCIIYAAGSTLVLWNWQQDTRLYLEGDGHASAIRDVAVTSHGLFAASASFETLSDKSYPTVVLWDLSGAAPGGQYGEVYRSRRASVSDPACHIVTSMRMGFSPGDGMLATVCVCRSGARESGGSCDAGTLQLCLFDWSHEFRLVQRCTIEGRGVSPPRSPHEEGAAGVDSLKVPAAIPMIPGAAASFSAAGVHIFAPEVSSMGTAAATVQPAAETAVSDGAEPLTDKKKVEEHVDGENTTVRAETETEEAFLCWCASSQLAIVYRTQIWIFETSAVTPGGGLALKHHRNIRDELLSKEGMRSRSRAKMGRGSGCGISIGTHGTVAGGSSGRSTMITGACFCSEYGLLLMISRAGRLIVCESVTGAVVNNVAPPDVSSVAGSARVDFTTLDVDADVCTVGTSNGTLWSLSVRELIWRRPLPFQKQIRARLLKKPTVAADNDELDDMLVAESDKRLSHAAKTLARGWPVVRAIALPRSALRTSKHGAVQEVVVALYADHTIAIFELTTSIASADGKVGAASSTAGTLSRKERNSRGRTRVGVGPDAGGGSVANHAVGHFGAVQGVCWHPERTASVLVTCSADQSVGVWQLIPIVEDISANLVASSEAFATAGIPAESASAVVTPAEKRVQLVRIIDVAKSICGDLPYSRCSRLTLAMASGSSGGSGGRSGNSAPGGAGQATFRLGGVRSGRHVNPGQRVRANRGGVASAVEVTALAYHPLGGQIAVGCSHGLVRVYSTISGRLLHMRDVAGSGEGGAGRCAGVRAAGGTGAYARGGEAFGESTGISSPPLSVPLGVDPTRASITQLCFSSTGRYLGVACRDGRSLALDGWSDWCRGLVLHPACLDPASTFSQGVVAFCARPALPRHATPRDPVASAASLGASRNSSAESVASTCGLVLLASDSLGLVTVVPSAARGLGWRRAGSPGGSRDIGGVGGATMNGDSTNVGAVDWSHGFERPRLLCEFRLDGAMRGIAVHPSGDYVVALSSRGTVLVYHVWLGQLRGIIPTIAQSLHRRPFDSVTTRANVIAVDPAGIYLAAVVPCYVVAERPGGGILGGQGSMRGTSTAGTHGKNDTSAETPTPFAEGGGGGGDSWAPAHQPGMATCTGGAEDADATEATKAEAAMARGNVVVFYELLTGAYAGRIARRWPVGAIKSIAWSPCGARIAVATSHDHCASVYRLRHGMWDNVRSALEAVRKDPEFWTRHPLFLHPFRPLSEGEGGMFAGARMDKDAGGGMTSRSSLTAISESIDAILQAAPVGVGEVTTSRQSGIRGGETVRTDRTGLTTARKRLSVLVVGNALDAARQNVMRKILLPADEGAATGCAQQRVSDRVRAAKG